MGAELLLQGTSTRTAPAALLSQLPFCHAPTAAACASSRAPPCGAWPRWRCC